MSQYDVFTKTIMHLMNESRRHKRRAKELENTPGWSRVAIAEKAKGEAYDHAATILTRNMGDLGDEN